MLVIVGKNDALLFRAKISLGKTQKDINEAYNELILYAALDKLDVAQWENDKLYSSY